MTAPPRDPVGWTDGTAATGHRVVVRLADGVQMPPGTPLYAAPAPSAEQKMRAAYPAESRDVDWVLAIGHALGLNSGFMVPLIPSVDEFRKLFAAIRAAPAPSAEHEGTAVQMWPAAQPAEPRVPVRVPCPNKVDGVCPLPNVHCAYPKCTEGAAPLSHVTPAEPPDDLVARLRDHASQYTDHSDLWGEAADTIERQASEIADLNRWVQELALRGDRLSDSLTQAEADRDALHECVRQMLEAVEPLVDFTSAATQIKFAEVLNAARAKVKP